MRLTTFFDRQPIFPPLLSLSLLLWPLILSTKPAAYGQTAPPANQPKALYPLDTVVSEAGTAYVVDRNLAGVWRWQDEELGILFQASAKFRTPLNAARSIALDKDGTLLVGDSSTRDVYRVTADGTAKPITGGKIGIPMDLGVSSDGTIYVADLELKVVCKIPAGTDQVETVAELNPRGLFVDNDDQVWVVTQTPQQLQRIRPDGKVDVIVAERTFEFPHQVVVNSAGVAFVSDGYKKAIWRIEPGEKPQVYVSGSPLDNPVGLSLFEDQVLITDPKATTVFRVDDDAKLQPWLRIKR